MDAGMRIDISVISCGTVKLKSGKFCDACISLPTSRPKVAAIHSTRNKLLTSFYSTIIDLEAVAILDKTQKPLRFNAFAIFYHWCLAGPCENTSIGGIDPMVPHITYKCEPEIDDATLEKLAADAAGKEAWFMCYY